MDFFTFFFEIFKTVSGKVQDWVGVPALHLVFYKQTEAHRAGDWHLLPDAQKYADSPMPPSVSALTGLASRREAAKLFITRRFGPEELAACEADPDRGVELLR